MKKLLENMIDSQYMMLLLEYMKRHHSDVLKDKYYRPADSQPNHKIKNEVDSLCSFYSINSNELFDTLKRLEPLRDQLSKVIELKKILVEKNIDSSYANLP